MVSVIGQKSAVHIDPGVLPEYDAHYRVIFLNVPEKKLKGFIAIHRKNGKHPSFGATRLWKYGNKTEALRDALRLSKMMSYKSALAGLPYGGAKAALIAPDDVDVPGVRRTLLEAYAEAVDSLKGMFVTGTDVGLMPEDVSFLRETSKFFVGVKADPTAFTALGVLQGIRTCLKKSSVKSAKVSYAIQGLGKIGGQLLLMLYPDAEKIYVSDTNEALVKAMKEQFPKIIPVSPESIHRQKADVFIPCALSGIINLKTIPEIQAKIVAGGANNQLESDRAGDLLWDRGIVYAPDFVINAGGLIAVADEFRFKKPSPKRIEESVRKIGKKIDTILSRSALHKKPPHRVANDMAVHIMRGYDKDSR